MVWEWIKYKVIILCPLSLAVEIRCWLTQLTFNSKSSLIRIMKILTFKYLMLVFVKVHFSSVAYSGFQKDGTFCWPLVLAQRRGGVGVKLYFQNLSYAEFFLEKKGP